MFGKVPMLPTEPEELWGNPRDDTSDHPKHVRRRAFDEIDRRPDAKADVPVPVIRSSSFDEALARATAAQVDRVYVLGGGELFREALGHLRCIDLHLHPDRQRVCGRGHVLPGLRGERSMVVSSDADAASRQWVRLPDRALVAVREVAQATVPVRSLLEPAEGRSPPGLVTCVCSCFGSQGAAHSPDARAGAPFGELYFFLREKRKNRSPDGGFTRASAL